MESGKNTMFQSRRLSKKKLPAVEPTYVDKPDDELILQAYFKAQG